MTAKLPPSASIATGTENGKLNAPSAERNADAIAELVTRIAPKSGHALEIASGTGQHIVRFARTLPGLIWTPSEVAKERRASIRAYRSEAGLANLAAPLHLDACQPGWSRSVPAQDLIITVNLLHLISEPAAKTLIREAAQTLRPGGVLMLYGPFLRSGKTTSDGDARFHGELQSADPKIGYKDRDDVLAWAQASGLVHREIIDMPANNLALIFTAP
jgi:SAM-dependent methyltransferase